MASQRSRSSFGSFCFSTMLLSLILNQVLAVPKLIFEDNFDTLNQSTWQQLITSWRRGENQFQYYTNRTENRYFDYAVKILIS